MFVGWLAGWLNVPFKQNSSHKVQNWDNLTPRSWINLYLAQYGVLACFLSPSNAMQGRDHMRKNDDDILIVIAGTGLVRYGTDTGSPAVTLTPLRVGIAYRLRLARTD